MIELTSVLFILLLFVFPLPVLAASLGLFTTWNLYKKYTSFKAQPAEGKKNLILSSLLFLINFICSIFLGITLSFAVHYFIFDNIYLFIFNFLFCSTISLRWFDFTHNLYRLFISKLKPQYTFTTAHFAICQGFRARDGFGLIPVYTDAGTLRLEGNQLVFKGVFREETFNSANISHAEKKSSEKIRIFTKQNSLKNAEVFIITLKEKFYPFKSRQDRDHIFEKLSAPIKPIP
jgi:hypothetical protein